MKQGQKTLWDMMQEMGFAKASTTHTGTYGFSSAPVNNPSPRRVFQPAPNMTKIDSTFTVVENKQIVKDGV